MTKHSNLHTIYNCKRLKLWLYTFIFNTRLDFRNTYHKEIPIAKRGTVLFRFLRERWLLTLVKPNTLKLPLQCFFLWYVSIRNLLEHLTTLIQTSFLNGLGYRVTSRCIVNVVVVSNSFFSKKPLGKYDYLEFLGHC